jgi:uncharacterized protein YbbK (DUF523 family)
MLAAQIDSFKHLEHHHARDDVRALHLPCSYNAIMSHDDDRPRVGVSRCLLGDEVRYDGGHKRDAIVIATLGPLVEWVPVCPEIEAGMGTPREAIDLVARDDGVPAGTARVRLLGVTSGTDWTDTIARFSAARARELVRERLDGYVLKSDSPSCGLERVRVHRAGDISRNGRGLFAEALVGVFPDLPIEEERNFQDAAVRERFIDSVFDRWRRRTRR